VYELRVGETILPIFGDVLFPAAAVSVLSVDILFRRSGQPGDVRASIFSGDDLVNGQRDRISHNCFNVFS
jgi:hypothetical protein